MISSQTNSPLELLLSLDELFDDDELLDDDGLDELELLLLTLLLEDSLDELDEELLDGELDELDELLTLLLELFDDGLDELDELLLTLLLDELLEELDEELLDGEELLDELSSTTVSNADQSSPVQVLVGCIVTPQRSCVVFDESLPVSVDTPFLKRVWLLPLDRIPTTTEGPTPVALEETVDATPATYLLIVAKAPVERITP